MKLQSRKNQLQQLVVRNQAISRKEAQKINGGWEPCIVIIPDGCHLGPRCSVICPDDPNSNLTGVLIGD